METALQMREIWAWWSWRGVLYLKPYLTAWINSPLFRCWAGAHPLLVLSFNNHAGFLSPAPVYSIIYRNNKPGVHCAGQSTLHHYTARMTEVPAVWICQGRHVKTNCTESVFKSPFQLSPSHILKYSPDSNRLGLRGASRISKSIFLNRNPSLDLGNFPYTQGKICEMERLRKFMILCVFWIACDSVRMKGGWGIF